MSCKHLQDETRKARKHHRCGLCELPINPGESYIARTGSGDDRIETFKMHAECEEATRRWQYEDWDDLDPREFRDELEEHRASKKGRAVIETIKQPSNNHQAKEESMEKILTFKEVCQAIVEGKQLQASTHALPIWHDIDMPTMNYIKVNHKYRIKPAKTLVPWNYDTAPREGWIRPNNDKSCTMRITYVSDIGAGPQSNAPSYALLKEEWQYSPNGIDGWRPAGQEVEG